MTPSATATATATAATVGVPSSRRPREPGAWHRAAIGAAMVAAALVLWFVAAALGWVTGARFPTPTDVAAAAKQIVIAPGYSGGTLWVHVWHSSRLVLMGFAIAVATGIPVGLAMGTSRRAEALIGPVFSMLRPIPPLAWIPLAILWLGLGDSAKLFLIWVASFAPAVINTYSGVRNVETVLVEAARVRHAQIAICLHAAIGEQAAVTEAMAGAALALAARGE